jgi:hypothetical protein
MNWSLSSGDDRRDFDHFLTNLNVQEPEEGAATVGPLAVH